MHVLSILQVKKCLMQGRDIYAPTALQEQLQRGKVDEDVAVALLATLGLRPKSQIRTTTNADQDNLVPPRQSLKKQTDLASGCALPCSAENDLAFPDSSNSGGCTQVSLWGFLQPGGCCVMRQTGTKGASMRSAINVHTFSHH